MPGRSAETSGACPASTPKSPSAPGTSTWSTSPENRSFSGETRLKWNWAIGCPSYPGVRRERCKLCGLRRLRRELLALVDGLLDGADHVEGGLRQVVVL